MWLWLVWQIAGLLLPHITPVSLLQMQVSYIMFPELVIPVLPVLSLWYVGAQRRGHNDIQVGGEAQTGGRFIQMKQCRVSCWYLACAENTHMHTQYSTLSLALAYKLPLQDDWTSKASHSFLSITCGLLDILLWHIIFHVHEGHINTGLYVVGKGLN